MRLEGLAVKGAATILAATLQQHAANMTVTMGRPSPTAMTHRSWPKATTSRHSGTATKSRHRPTAITLLLRSTATHPTDLTTTGIPCFGNARLFLHVSKRRLSRSWDGLQRQSRRRNSIRN